jgi:PHD/YefM family antitoxin component YafN of YafNO toxin-antitoxin module
MNQTPQIVPITDLRKSSPDVLNMLANGPVFLAQRSRAAAVLLSPQQWDTLNAQLEDLTALADYLEVKLALAEGQSKVVDVTLDELKAEVDGVSATI